MRIRWLWFDYIPPELALTPAQRREARKRARHIVRWHGAPMMTVLLCVTLFILVGGIVIWQLLLPPGSSAAGIAAAALLGFFTAHWWCLALLSRKHFAPAMHRALSEMGYEVCWKCGYLLIGLDTDQPRCPECGAQQSERREPIPWNDASRRAIAECGYHACTECGAVFKDSEQACPECGKAITRDTIKP